MKKYITFLLILTIFLTFKIEKVSAIQVKTKIGSGYSTGITWNQTGMPGSTVLGVPNKGEYKDYKKTVTTNGKAYEAFCVDPGLSFRTNKTYNCAPTSDPGLKYLVSQYNGTNYSEIQLAIRLYAQMKGYGSSKQVAMKAAVLRFWQIKLGFPELILEGCRNMGITCSPNANDYLSGNDALVAAAYQKAEETFYASVPGGGLGGGLKFNKLASSTRDRVDYSISLFSKVDKIKFVCEGCTIIGPDEFDSPGSAINMSVVPAPNCEPFRIKAYYVPSGVQMCTLADAGTVEEFQYVVADFSADADTSQSIDTSGEPTDIFTDSGIDCAPDCCTEVDIEPNHIESDIHNCCIDSTHSWAKEYELNQLTCYSEQFKVNHYWKMCNAENYLDKKMNGEVNEYCDIYCTERVTVDVPGAITATSGRYFDLTTTVQGTKSPYVEGFKRCRTLINFKKWQDDYRVAVEEQVRQYNEYQRNRLYELMYQDAIEASSQCSLTIRVNCTGQSDSESRLCTHGIFPNITTNTCSASASTTNETGLAFDQTKSYTRFKFVGAPHRDLPYHFVKLDEGGYNHQAEGYYNFYKLKYDSTDTAKHPNDWEYYYVADMIAQARSVKSAKESIRDTDSDDCCSASAGVSCTWEFIDSCGNSEGDLTSKTEDVRATHATYQTAASQAKAAYQAAVISAKTLELKIDKCDKYFTAYEGTNAKANFPFQSLLFGFEYTQVYLTEFGDLKKDVILVPFENAPGCQITGPFLGPDAEDGLVEAQYSTKYFSDKTTEAEDFGKGDIEWELEPTGFQKYRDTMYLADQKFVQDAKYKATCYWNEPPNTKYTLVQQGGVHESDFNTTMNDRQYHIHLSTLEGEYDTRWLLSGLGTNSKFDPYFAERGSVCSTRQNASSDGLFHCVLKVDYEIISTGKCNGNRTTTEVDECEAYEASETVLNFKIVDPATVFTCNSTEECGYAYNWFDMPGGRETLNDIRRKGSNLETYSPSNQTYQVTLTSKDMKQIKNYNSYRENNRYGGYSDFSLICDCPDTAEECNEVGGTQTCKRSKSCRMCRSVFLNNLYDGFVNYGSTYPVTQAKGNIENIRNSGHVHWAG